MYKGIEIRVKDIKFEIFSKKIKQNIKCYTAILLAKELIKGSIVLSTRLKVR